MVSAKRFIFVFIPFVQILLVPDHIIMCIVQNLISEVRVLVPQLIFNLAFHVLHNSG